MTTQKSSADSIADGPSGNTLADRVNDADGFVPGHDGLAGIGSPTLDSEDVAVAYAAALHAKPDVTCWRLMKFTLHQLELPLPGYLERAIGRHAQTPSTPCTVVLDHQSVTNAA